MLYPVVRPTEEDVMMDDAHGRTWTLPFGERAELELAAGRGDFALVPVDPGEAAWIEVAGRGVVDGVEVSRVGNVVRVEVDRDNHVHRSGRDSRATLHVPRDVRAEIHTHAGSVEARDLGPCELAVKTGAGRIALSDVYGRLRLSTGAGQIAGHGLGGSIDAETNAGAVLLDIGALDPGDHHIRNGAGAIRLELAYDIDARIDVRPGRGSVQSDYPTRQHAAAVLHVSTDVGSIRIRGTHFQVAPRAPIRTSTVESRDETESRFAPTTPSSVVEERAGAGALSETNVERILKLVESGKLSARDAKELLEALERGR